MPGKRGVPIMDGEAIVDTALEAGETTDQSVVDVTTETVEVPTESTTDAPVTDLAAPATPYRAVTEDGKRLDEKARATIEELKAKDPALAKEIRNALFEADRFRRALPGGLKEVQELRQTVEKLGGPEGIQGMQEKLTGWDSFDQQYMAADPKALEFMLSTPESQQAFMKLAPMAFNKFEELNPDGYASYICQRIVGDAVANDVPVALKLAQHFLAAGDASKANEQFEKVVAWFQALDTTAKKQVVAPKAEATPADPRVKELEAERDGMVRESWLKESAEIHNKIYNEELSRLAGNRKITDAERAAILHEVQFKLTGRAKEQSSKVERYFAVKDKDGYIKLADTFGRQSIPELVRKAFDKYVAAKPGPKPVASAAPGPVRPPVNGAKPSDGAAFVQQMPTREQIDWDSPLTKIREGRAMTVQGKLVTWRK